MGCLNATSSANDAKPQVDTMRRAKISINEGRKQQGVHELKQNYIIDNKTKVLGVGAFGRVFMTTNKFE